jgi:hypothetical protein
VALVAETRHPALRKRGCPQMGAKPLRWRARRRPKQHGWRQPAARPDLADVRKGARARADPTAAWGRRRRRRPRRRREGRPRAGRNGSRCYLAGAGRRGHRRPRKPDVPAQAATRPPCSYKSAWRGLLTGQRLPLRPPCGQARGPALPPTPRGRAPLPLPPTRPDPTRPAALPPAGHPAHPARAPRAGGAGGPGLPRQRGGQHAGHPAGGAGRGEGPAAGGAGCGRARGL